MPLRGVARECAQWGQWVEKGIRNTGIWESMFRHRNEDTSEKSLTLNGPSMPIKFSNKWIYVKKNSFSTNIYGLLYSLKIFFYQMCSYSFLRNKKKIKVLRFSGQGGRVGKCCDHLP